MDFKFIPHSDIEIKDEERIATHKEAVNSMDYNGAVDTAYELGTPFCSQVFNRIEGRIKELQVYLLNKQAKPDEFYSLTEPTAEQMNGKLYWIKPL